MTELNKSHVVLEKFNAFVRCASEAEYPLLRVSPSLTPAATNLRSTSKASGVLAYPNQPFACKASENDDGEDDGDDDEPSPEDDDLTKPEILEKRKRRLRIKGLKKKRRDNPYEFTNGGSDVLGIVFLEIKNIKDLPPESNFTKTSFDMDPFVVASLGRKTFRTKTINHNLNPVFNEKMIFQVLSYEQAYSFSFTVIDRDKYSGNDFIASASLPLRNFIERAPKANPETGLYELRDPPEYIPVSQRGRFKRLGLSRSSSSQSLVKAARQNPSKVNPLTTAVGGSTALDYHIPKISGVSELSMPQEEPSSAAILTSTPSPSTVSDMAGSGYVPTEASTSQLISGESLAFESSGTKLSPVLDDSAATVNSRTSFFPSGVEPLETVYNSTSGNIVSSSAYTDSVDTSETVLLGGDEGDALGRDDLNDRDEEHVVEIRECPICHQPRLDKRSDADIITHIATCASQDWRQVNNLVMGGFVTASQAQRKWYSKVITKISYGGYKIGANSANILVQDRVTGHIIEEKMSVYVRLGIRLLYKGLRSNNMENKRIRKMLKGLSVKQGRKRLLGSSYAEEASRFTNGTLGIFRLAPQDYHRFHVPVDGVLGRPSLIAGEYYTVNPMAIRSTLDVYGENVRVIVPIDSDVHGRVMVVCVGAMMVGSTVITRKENDRVQRAEELGYFKFGGSTIVLLFEEGRMRFDDDLIENSGGALETLIRAGTSIGHSPSEPQWKPDMPKDEKEITEQDKLEAKRRIQGSTLTEDISPEESGGDELR
ncbi:C2 domain-containing protein [Niveomyces insectorum RCEF 264]|uniref:C2 domain-containing protein n=1 Tax=Niveomyces insectorum RCEF 264 TaxID=1081102 RepID=A0A167LIB2_9HYPO|nr:C2 domain-containing protein [Niveomyces insectorum RCEF 264]